MAGDEIKIKNILGEDVFNQMLVSQTSNIKLETLNLNAGIYFIEMVSSGKKSVAKFVKQ